MKRFLILYFSLALSFVAFSQDSTQVAKDTTVVIEVPDAFPTGGNVVEMITWAINNWQRIIGTLTVALLALSLVLRAIPTKNNWDPLTRLIVWLENVKYLRFLTKNRSTNGESFNTKISKE